MMHQIAQRCTWARCERVGHYQQLDSTDQEWAVLCLIHHRELHAAVESLHAKKMLRAWALAKARHPRTKIQNRLAAKAICDLLQLLRINR